jgi:hypothetical protein
MSATPQGRKIAIVDNHDQRAGSIALVLLKFTLIGAAAALVATLAHVAWKVIAG